MRKHFCVFVLLVTMLALAVPAMSQESASDADDLSKKTANPLANLISLPLQNNSDFNLGPYDRTRNVLNIQPVIPLMGGRIITRTILPVVWLPDFTAPSGMASTGLGDLLFTAFYTPPSNGDLTWGVGLAVEMPSGGSERGREKWSAGPSVVALKQPGAWTLGILANNVWSFAGESTRADVNKALINLFLVRQLGNGWYVNSAPIITADWEADSGQKWVVPLGAGFGKLAFAGKLPINTQVGAYVNVVKPDFGPDWQLRVQMQFILPMPGN